MIIEGDMIIALTIENIPLPPSKGEQIKFPLNSPPLEGQGWWAGGCFFCLLLVAPKEGFKQTKMTKEKKCHSERSEESRSWHTYCYDAILHFVQNDSGGRGRMTECWFVISSPGHVINPLQKRVMTSQIAVIATTRNEAGSNPERLIVCGLTTSSL